MPNILHLLAIGAPRARVYAALTTADGVRSWWTRETELDTATRDQQATEREKHDHDSQLPAPAKVLAQSSRQVQEAATRHRDLAARPTDPHWLTIPAEDPVRDISPPSRSRALSAGPRSSNRPSPRSRRRPGSWNESPTAT